MFKENRYLQTVRCWMENTFGIYPITEVTGNYRRICVLDHATVIEEGAKSYDIDSNFIPSVTIVERGPYASETRAMLGILSIIRTKVDDVGLKLVAQSPQGSLEFRTTEESSSQLNLDQQI